MFHASHEGRLNTGPRSLHGLLRWSRNKRRLTGAAKVQYTGNPRSRIERWPSESARWHSMHTRVVREKDFDVIVSSLQPPWKTVKITQPVYNSTYTGRPSWLFVGKLWNVRRGWNDWSGSGDRKREWERKRSRVYCPRKNCHRAYTIHIYLDGGAS